MYKNKIKISLSLLFLIHGSTFSMEKSGRRFLNGTLETTFEKKWDTQTLKTYKLYVPDPKNQISWGRRIACISYLIPNSNSATQLHNPAHPPQLSAFDVYFQNDEIKLIQTKAFFETIFTDLRKQGFQAVHMHSSTYKRFQDLEMEDYPDAVPLEEELVVTLSLEKVRPPSPPTDFPPPLPPRPSTPSPDSEIQYRIITDH